MQSLEKSAAGWTARLQELWPGDVQERLQQLGRCPPTPVTNRHFALERGYMGREYMRFPLLIRA